MFATCPNFRDLGGLRTAEGAVVRRGRLFRSSGLHDLSGADAAGVCGLDITTVIDLRAPFELDEHGTGALYELARAPRHVHAPIFLEVPGHWVGEASWADPDRVAGIYLEMTDLGRDSIRRVFGLLGQEETYPAVFHCMAGRDRTGVLAALLLSVLGVPRDAIEADYVRTREALPEPPVHDGVMHRFLDGLADRYGSAQTYLGDLGVGADDLASLRTALLEAPGG